MVWGHSYTAGVGATTPAKGFSAIVAEMLGLELRNNAIGGTTLFHNDSAGFPSILYNTTRPQGRFASPCGVVLSMYGINDINHLGNTYAALDPFKQCQRVAISRWRAGAIFEDSDASVTYGGVWTSWATNFTVQENSGISYCYASNTGTSFTITTPADFPGGTMAVGSLGIGNGVGAIITSPTINGTTYSMDTRSTTPGVSIPYVLRIPNVPAGSAAYTFTLSSVVNGYGWMGSGPQGPTFDYWQWEPSEADCPLVVLVKQPYPQDLTAYGSVAPGPPTNAGIDQLNQVFDDLAAEFGGRVLTVDTSSVGYNILPSAWVPGDVHPRNNGHLKIAGLIRDAILAKIRVQQRRQVIAPRIEYSNYVPTTSGLHPFINFNIGDRVENTNPTPGSPSGWVCTTAGAPGVWQALPSLIARTATAVLVAGTVTIANTAITANSIIRLSSKTLGGTPGALFVSAKTAATSFVINSTSGTDTSTVQYDILAY
jgi:hypothetical protein